MKMFVPVQFAGAIEEWCRKLAEAIRAILEGRLDWTADVTLVPGATETVFADLRIRTTSIVLFAPLTANAAASAPWASSIGAGLMTITHTSSAATDRRYRALFIG